MKLARDEFNEIQNLLAKQWTYQTLDKCINATVVILPICFSVMESPLCFANVDFVIIPATSYQKVIIVTKSTLAKRNGQKNRTF